MLVHSMTKHAYQHDIILRTHMSSVSLKRQKDVWWEEETGGNTLLHI